MSTDPNDPSERLLEIHGIISQELRHTATIVWQFSIAIITLQGTAIGLSGQDKFSATHGKWVLTAAFFVSICFSLMLVRQARERGGFVRRIKAVEDELSKTYPTYFMPIQRTLAWFKSEVLAWILVVESVIGFVIFLRHIGVLEKLCRFLG